MNIENFTPKKVYTDADRDNVRRLAECGMTTREIADIMHIGKTTVGYIKSAYTACVNKDYDILRNLYSYVKPTVLWAMRITNTDPSVLEDTESELAPEVKSPEMATQPITRADYLAMLDAVLDIRNLLTEIRDRLN